MTTVGRRPLAAPAGRIRAAAGAGGVGAATAGSARSATESKGPTVSGAEKRSLEKEQQSLERRIKTADGKLAELDVELAGFDYSDSSGKAADLQRRRAEQCAALGELELRWLEVSELLG